MNFNRRLKLRSLTYRETAPLDDKFLDSKNCIISGDFFPFSESLFKEKLLKRNINVQPQMTPDTEILICGRYPDWVLVEEARMYGVKIIFVDKAGELFSRMVTKMKKSRTVLTCEEPVEI